MLSQFTYRRLLSLLGDEMEADEFGLHTISSVYFDTDAYDIIRTSVQKPVFKEKLRLRWYGDPGPQDTVFLEIKRKYHGRVYKRRVPIRTARANRLLHDDALHMRAGQIGKEVNWFMQRYRPAPKLLLAYDREALTGKHDEGLRITFDHNIRWRDTDLELTHGSYGTPLFQDDTVLMEIKAFANIPMWLSNLLAAERIYPTSFSKYGTWYQQFHLRKGKNQYVG